MTEQNCAKRPKKYDPNTDFNKNHRSKIIKKFGVKTQKSSE